MSTMPRTDPAMAAARAAAAGVVRTHQRRHPSSAACSCSWSPKTGDRGWATHVAEQLEHAGLLTTPTAPNAGDPSA